MPHSKADCTGNAQDILAHFFGAITSGESLALLLDYDGTLAPFHVDPAKTLPYPGVRELLIEIQACRRCRTIL
jgi:trehalose-6-phosphatase